MKITIFCERCYHKETIVADDLATREIGHTCLGEKIIISARKCYKPD